MSTVDSPKVTLITVNGHFRRQTVTHVLCELCIRTMINENTRRDAYWLPGCYKPLVLTDYDRVEEKSTLELSF